MFTAVICAIFFPDKFTITVFILFSMAFLFAGIYCYEKKTFRVPVDSNSCPSAKEKGVKWSRCLFYASYLCTFLLKLLPLFPLVLRGLSIENVPKICNFVNFVDSQNLLWILVIDGRFQFITPVNIKWHIILGWLTISIIRCPQIAHFSDVCWNPEY